MSTIDKKQENEHEKHVLHFEINEKEFKTHEQFIAGVEIRDLGNIPKEDEIFLLNPKPWDDELIKDDSKIDLARRGKEIFYSKKHQVHHESIIIVNGREKKWHERTSTIQISDEDGVVDIHFQAGQKKSHGNG